MSDVPELTDREAAVLRFAALYRDAGPDRTESYCEDLASQGLVKPQGGITDRGRETLAAFDRRKTAQIRADAMRECEAIAEAQCELWKRIGDPRISNGCIDVRDQIRKAIAKEETRA